VQLELDGRPSWQSFVEKITHMVGNNVKWGILKTKKCHVPSAAAGKAVLHRLMHGTWPLDASSSVLKQWKGAPRLPLQKKTEKLPGDELKIQTKIRATYLSLCEDVTCGASPSKDTLLGGIS
jgi:hypothetical protein